eukprot:TRINITY_DN6975_c0_g1_i1.p1 TRINITY_DN6975_c0_g1~~TRINITY_DN6975_c0_g1_i1.p1  ORF type:complete len:318 (-),score=58.39 TRINITY_DN6975_c0_g1_i1:1085-2038(-)
MIEESITQQDLDIVSSHFCDTSLRNILIREPKDENIVLTCSFTNLTSFYDFIYPEREITIHVRGVITPKYSWMETYSNASPITSRRKLITDSENESSEILPVVRKHFVADKKVIEKLMNFGYEITFREDFNELFYDVEERILTKRDYWVRKREKKEGREEEYSLKIKCRKYLKWVEWEAELKTFEEINATLSREFELNLTSLEVIARLNTHRITLEHCDYPTIYIDASSSAFGYETSVGSIIINNEDDISASDELDEMLELQYPTDTKIKKYLNMFEYDSEEWEEMVENLVQKQLDKLFYRAKKNYVGITRRDVVSS